MPFLPLTPAFSVSGQISADDVTVAKTEGFDLIINNRPDHEDVGQPLSAEIEAAALKLDIKYITIPIGSGGMQGTDFDALATALQNSNKILAFCRTGTRSTLLRAYTLARAGAPAETLIEEASHAGYDLRPHRNALEQLAATT